MSSRSPDAAKRQDRPYLTNLDERVGPGLIIARAREHSDYQPFIRTICLTSGGGDSTVLAHRCRDYYDELVHIDTGTALPGVRDFVEEFATWIQKPLRVVEAGDAYRDLVLGKPGFWNAYKAFRLDGERPEEYKRRIKREGETRGRAWRMEHGLHLAPLGFPGPGGHSYAYQRLKERALQRGLRDIKTEFGRPKKQRQRVMLLSGVRLDESGRRKFTGTARGFMERKGNQVWVNPLLQWTNEEMREYRKTYNLPVSDVSALTHRSGECNCLAFVSQGERDFIISMYPEWYRDTILPIEQEAERLGLERSRWGWADKESVIGYEQVGPMCAGCELRASELAA